MTKKVEKPGADIITVEAEVMPKTILTAKITEQGIVGSKAKQIEEAFLPMITMLNGFEEEFNAIVTMPVGEESSKAAGDLRKRMVKVRTGGEKIHKEQKAEVLRLGRAIDGVKNVLEYAVMDKEAALEKIEKHFENIKKEKDKVIREQREVLIKPYGYDFSQVDLSQMDDTMFDFILKGAKSSFEEKQEAERVAEETAKQAEIDAAEKAKAQAVENERLKKEAAEKAAALAPIKDQLNDWVKGMSIPAMNIREKNHDAFILKGDIEQKFDAFKNWALHEITKLK